MGVATARVSYGLSFVALAKKEARSATCPPQLVERRGEEWARLSARRNAHQPQIHPAARPQRSSPAPFPAASKPPCTGLTIPRQGIDSSAHCDAPTPLKTRFKPLLYTGQKNTHLAP
jgi:hypothetical protein